MLVGILSILAAAGLTLVDQLIKLWATVELLPVGPIGTITVVSDAVGNVRGCVTEPNVPLVEKYPGKLDVGATVGTDGTLTVIRDLQMKEPYVGSVELVSGEIGDDVTAYFVQSEQIPTACALGVLVDRDHSVKAAGGYLIQLLPGAPEGIIDRLEKGIMAAGPVTNLLMENDDPESLLRRVMKDFELEILETVPVEYRCYCSRERMAAALVSLGRKQLTELAEDPAGVEGPWTRFALERQMISLCVFRGRGRMKRTDQSAERFSVFWWSKK